LLHSNEAHGSESMANELSAANEKKNVANCELY